MPMEKQPSQYQIGDMLHYMTAQEYFIVTDITFINGWPVRYDLMQLDKEYRCHLDIGTPIIERFKKIS